MELRYSYFLKLLELIFGIVILVVYITTYDFFDKLVFCIVAYSLPLLSLAIFCIEFRSSNLEIVHKYLRSDVVHSVVGCLFYISASAIALHDVVEDNLFDYDFKKDELLATGILGIVLGFVFLLDILISWKNEKSVSRYVSECTKWIEFLLSLIVVPLYLTMLADGFDEALFCLVSYSITLLPSTLYCIEYFILSSDGFKKSRFQNGLYCLVGAGLYITSSALELKDFAHHDDGSQKTQGLAVGSLGLIQGVLFLIDGSLTLLNLGL